MLLSEIISKPIISLNEGKIVGVVSNAIFSNFLTKVLHFEIIPEDENQKEILIDKDGIKHVGEDALILKQNYNFTAIFEPYISNPINGLAYSTTGKLLGKIINVEIDNKYNVINILTNTHTLKIESLVSHSNSLYIFNLEDKKVRKITNNFNFPKTQREIKVNSLPLIKETPATVIPTPTPAKTITNSELLLGKRVTRNIQTLNGEIIAKKGYVINSKILLSATKNQKLRELAIYSE